MSIHGKLGSKKRIKVISSVEEPSSVTDGSCLLHTASAAQKEMLTLPNMKQFLVNTIIKISLKPNM